MKILKTIQITSVVLIAIGAAGVAPTLYYRYKFSNVNAAPVVPVQVAPNVLKAVPTAITGDPVSIMVPSLSLSVPVVHGVYDKETKEWNLGLITAQFATITTQPNNLSGDTYIYGHYRPAVFAYLHNIKDGGEAMVDSANGYRFTYKLRERHDVGPADTSIFSYTGSPILTLQTCSGAWFQNRQQFTFDFVSVQELKKR